MHRNRKRPGVGADAPSLPQAGPDDPASRAVVAALAAGLYALRAHEPSARAGDAHGVHQLRTTTRRLRTALALFRDLTDPDQADRLAGELKWHAGLLGAVRDLDVLTERFRSAAAETGTAGAVEPLFESLRGRHGVASAALREALGGERYAGLTAGLDGLAASTPPGVGPKEPCRAALPPLVRTAWKSLKKAGRSLGPDDPDDHFHEARKRAKRTRYAAEAVADALDRPSAADARRFARRARAVQDMLGSHQDAVVAAFEVAQAAASHPDLGPFNLAAGRLLEREHREAADTRARFFRVWADLDRKKVVRWLRP